VGVDKEKEGRNDMEEIVRNVSIFRGRFKEGKEFFERFS
jgi:hypothetical protein